MTDRSRRGGVRAAVRGLSQVGPVVAGRRYGLGLGAAAGAALALLVDGAAGGLTGAAVTARGAQAAGTITGRVTVAEAPPRRMVAVTTDQAVCGDEVEDRAVVADAAGGLANAVVIAVGAPWSGPPPAPVIDNVGCYFEPRVQVVPTRSVVTVRSRDDTLHTTHAYDDRQRTLFNIAIPIPGMEVQRPLRRPGPVRIECDSHGWMRGWVYVSDDAGTVTGPDGTFTLDGVPPGAYRLTVWHERYAGAARQITVDAGGVVEAAFTLE